jgi:hypothetical protein
MGQIKGFSVKDSIITTVRAAVGAYGLKSLSGSEGQFTVLEDVPAIAKDYKPGDDIAFTVTFNAIFDPEKVRAVKAEEESVIIDGEVVKEES